MTINKWTARSKKDISINMKNLIIVLFVLLTTSSFGQKTVQIDTNTICFPTEVGRQILTDLNELDKLKKEKILTDEEIKNLELKTVNQDSIISKLEQKDVNNKILIEANKEKYTLVEEDNKNLRQEIKKNKLKNTIVNIVSGAVLTTITFVEIFK